MRSNQFKNVRLEFRGGSKKKLDDGDNHIDADDETMMDDGNDEGEFDGDGGRIFLGKNKLLQIALGRTPEDEYSDNLHMVSKLLSGSVGILLTNRSSASVESYFKKLAVDDFARAGNIASRTVVLPQSQIETQYPVSMVEQFRKLGLPVEVRDGRMTFIGRDMKEYVVCKEGQELSVEQCKILVHMGVKLATFRIGLLCRWEKDSGSVENFDE